MFIGYIKIMKKTLLLLLLMPSIVLASNVLVDLPSKHLTVLSNNGLKFKNLKKGKLSTIKLKEKDLGKLSSIIHQENLRCGGFVTRKEGLKTFKNLKGWDDNRYNVDYKINKVDVVTPLLKQVSESRILADMLWFGSYKTRYYSSPEGIKAMNDLGTKWKKLAKGRSDITVEMIDHKDWKQKSVVLTIKGQSDENIILGGHGDSINSDDEGPHSHSPGIDDNASGISVITEVIRILIQNQYRPKHNLQFMAFAAEEVGLRGSGDISSRYDQKVKKIRGMLNIDGTNYRGSSDLNLTIISDETDKEQNQFLGSLIDKYLGLPWGYDKCNYGCSDHYSFSKKNFRASFAFESRVAEENPRIHTADDTIDVSGGSATHSVSFAKLGLSYLLELDK